MKQRFGHAVAFVYRSVSRGMFDNAADLAASLPHGARIALVTVEKDRWDEEANDVMKIIGRHRWLKMVLLEGGGRGLAERLELLDAILYVPRAREAVEPFDAAGRVLVELARQATPRARERLLHAIGSAT